MAFRKFLDAMIEFLQISVNFFPKSPSHRVSEVVVDLVNLEFSSSISVKSKVVVENFCFGLVFETLQAAGTLVSAIGNIFRI